MSSTIVIDFEGFQLKSQCFVIKELAFYSVNEGYHNCWFFLPPHSWENLLPSEKKCFKWVIKNRHHMEWNSGVLPYSTLHIILQYLSSVYTNIYVKGLEKIKFLENILGRSILSVNCPKIQMLNKNRFSTACSYHPHAFNCCALTKAAFYADYIKQSSEEVDFIYNQDVL